MPLTPHMYKIITLKANAEEIITWKCFWCQICTKCYFEGKCSENRHFKMHLAPNMYKIITFKANAKEIITFKCIWHQICTKLLLWRQMLRKSSLLNAFSTTYVQNRYFAGKCSGNHYFKMHLAPHMYKIVTLKANAKKIITSKCIWHHICAKTITMKANAKEIITWKCLWHHICTKSLLWRQMLRKSSLENAFDVKFVQNVTLKANAQKIATLKCIWHQICTKSLLSRQMLRKSSLLNAFGTKYVQNCYFEGKC